MTKKLLLIAAVLAAAFGANGATENDYIRDDSGVIEQDVCLPTAPDSIVLANDACIATNMPDTVTLSLSGTVSNQTYDWILPTDWSLISANSSKTQISVRTNGVAGAHTVSAFAVGDEVCGNSDTTSVVITISEPSGEITYSESMEAYRAPRGMSSYHWYLLHNGTVINDAFDDANSRLAAYTDSYYQLGDLVNSTEYTVVVEVVLSNGCKERYTYGAPINPGISYNNAPQNHILRSTKKANGLIVTPNPATSNLNVEMQGTNEKFKIKIVDLSGSIVYSADGASLYEINISSLAAGQYLIMAYTPNNRISSKFIKK